MPTINPPAHIEDPIYRCPNCDEEITRVQYNVDTREYGTAYLTQERSGPNQAYQTETSDHESDGSDWTGDTDYSCTECGEDLRIRDIIIEAPEPDPEEEKKVIAAKAEEEAPDAIESVTHIIITRKDNKIKSYNGYDFSNLGLNVCDECGFTFIADPMEGRGYHCKDKDEIIFCPQCMAVINKVENEEANLKRVTAKI